MADRAYESGPAARDSDDGAGGNGALTEVRDAGASTLDALARIREIA